MPNTVGRWTAEMVRALPEDRDRNEVIDGERWIMMKEGVSVTVG